MFDIFFEFMVSKYGLKLYVSSFKLQIILFIAKSGKYMAIVFQDKEVKLQGFSHKKGSLTGPLS
jgi:hypothetical protein